MKRHCPYLLCVIFIFIFCFLFFFSTLKYKKVLRVSHIVRSYLTTDRVFLILRVMPLQRDGVGR